MENEARNEVQATQESTDEVILNTVLTMNGKDTSDEGEYDEDEKDILSLTQKQLQP